MHDDETCADDDGDGDDHGHAFQWSMNAAAVVRMSHAQVWARWYDVCRCYSPSHDCNCHNF